MNKTLKTISIIFTAVFIFTACDRFEGNVSVPSFLRIEAMNVEDNPSDSWSLENGFFTSEIDAVNVVIWVSGDTAETNLGTFQLPCDIPVLRNGKIDRILINPVVKQDGIAGKRINYPYYESVTLTDVILAEQDTTNLGTIATKYVSKSRMKVLWQEFFEPGPNSFSLDSVVMPFTSLDSVRSGYGSGVVHIRADQSSVSFWSDTTYRISDPSAIVYIEMDYWSDIDFSVGLYNPIYEGGANVLKSHMTIYGKPEKRWQKIYINIGSLWSKTYSHYPNIRPYFTVLNDKGKEGNLYLDNIKLVVLD